MMNGLPDFITIKGAPGAGKTQAAKSLASFFKNGVRLEVDTLRSMVISPEWTNQEEHTQILTLAVALSAGFNRLGYHPVIVVDTFSGDKLARFISELKELDEHISCRSFALIAEPEELARRLENRPSDEFKDLEISMKLNSQVSKYMQEGEVLIDTTLLSPFESAERMHLYLEGSGM